MRALIFATAVFLFLGGSALADEPVATAPAGPGAPAAPPAPAPLPQGEARATDASQPMALGPCGPEKVKPDGRLETAPHGEVEAGVGTDGYRHLGAAVCQPLGQDGAIAISAGETQGGWGYRRP